MKILNTISVSVFLMGCGSSFTSGKEGVENMAGSGDSGEAGITDIADSNSTAGATNNSAGSMNDTAGNSNNSGGVGNVSGTNSVGGNNSAGQMNSGGSNNAGNSGANNGGVGGLSCKPKITCETYAISKSSIVNNTEKRVTCGPLIDDCGNVIQCGGCPDYYGACGSGTDTVDQTAGTYNKDAIPGIPNICGGGCFLYHANSAPDGNIGSTYYCYNSPYNDPAKLKANPPDATCTFYSFLPNDTNAIPGHAEFYCFSSDLFNIGM